jgi:hypothetical protein
MLDPFPDERGYKNQIMVVRVNTKSIPDKLPLLNWTIPETWQYEHKPLFR